MKIDRDFWMNVVKFLVGAIAGVLGMSVSGCASVPMFIF